MAVKGAFLNVRINSSGLDDKDFVTDIIHKGKDIVKNAETIEQEILALVERNL
jgi:glutamate formiminotransferase/formiminotetrahydrofolate cyclodeaminase